MSWRSTLFILIVLFNYHCSSKKAPVTVVREYLKAESVAEAQSLLHPEYRLYFNDTSGTGMSKEEVVPLQAWDKAMHPTYTYYEWEQKDEVVIVHLKEENELTRLINFPGWKARVIFWTHGDKITKQLYQPDPDNPDFREKLDPAIMWLENHAPIALREVCDTLDNRLIMNGATAPKWIDLLQKWRNSNPTL